MSKPRSLLATAAATASITALLVTAPWWGTGCTARAEASAGSQQPPEKNLGFEAERVPELGLVHFRRGFAAARAEAQRTHKPLVVLFDEVPGCSTVLAYGREVLSDLFVVDALETLTVPVLVRNNTSADDDGADGDDARVLRAFGEPAWNNPVVRFVDADKTDADVVNAALAPRLTRLDRASLLQHVVVALRAHGDDVPPWLALVVETPHADVATFTAQTGCFWQGEQDLGGVDGVVMSTPGFVDGHEVVRLRFDPAKVSASHLASVAKAAGHRPLNDDSGFRAAPASDDKHLLRATRYRALLPLLTPAQATRVNAALAAGEDPLPWLAPHQRQRLR